jgi:hypothetical protein
MRSKQEYVLTENEKGKQAPKKVGMAPVQREGMEYEFTTVFDVAMNHETAVSKDRTDLFGDNYFKITEETGAKLKGWLDKGVERAPKQESEAIAQHGQQDAHKKAPVGKIEFPDDLGSFKIPFGKKFKDKQLKDVPQDEIEGFVKWCEEKAVEAGKPLSPDAEVLRQAVHQYYHAHKEEPGHEADVPF